MELIIVLHASSSCQVIASLLNYPCPTYALDLRVHVFSVMQLKQHSWDLKLHTSSFKCSAARKHTSSCYKLSLLKKKMFSGYNTYNYTFTAQAKPHTIARMFSANNTHSRTILHENIYVQFYTKTSQKLQLNNWALYTRSVLLMPFQGEPKIDSGSHT